MKERKNIYVYYVRIYVMLETAHCPTCISKMFPFYNDDMMNIFSIYPVKIDMK